MATLTLKQKKVVNELTADGKSCLEIKTITGIDYKSLYSYINRFSLAETAKAHYIAHPKAKKNIVKITAPTKYVDTGRELPPIYKSEMIIIADKNLAELACQQMGLKPPVCSLSQRPLNYNANGWVRAGNKWVAGQPIHNDGMLTRQPLFLKS